MARRLKIKTLENSLIHFDYRIGGQNYTVCGLETGGDLGTGIHSPKEVKSKVNCPFCIRMVEFCQTIRRAEWQ